MNEKLWFQARQYSWLTQDSTSASKCFKLQIHLHRHLRGCRFIANIVRATFVGLNIRAGVDIATWATSIVADPVDFRDVYAIRLLIDRDTVTSCSSNLKDKRVYVNNEYLWMDIYRQIYILWPWLKEFSERQQFYSMSCTDGTVSLFLCSGNNFFN